MADAVDLTTLAPCRGGVFRMGTLSWRLDRIQQMYAIPYRDLFTPEVPQHEVDLAPFAIEIHPVTNAQLLAFLTGEPGWRPDRIARQLHNRDYLKHWDGMRYPAHLANHPVVYVCWYAAVSPRANPIAGDGWLAHGDATQVTTRRVIRGGSWGGAPVNLRVSYRDSHPPIGAGPHVGFRCAQSAGGMSS